MDDAELLREYAERHSDPAFTELVERHVNLVYSTALRMVRDPALAEDVVQSVFVQLARKAPTIRDGNALPGWLYRVTHCQAANALRAERTRRVRETEAMMQAEIEANTAWEYIGSGLEEAMHSLSAADQNLVVLRFFEERNWREVGEALALSEDTVQRRACRALEKMRAHFARRGVAVSSSVIGLTIAANAVHAAPAGLASAMAGASLAGASGAGSFTFSTFIKWLLVNKAKCSLLAVAVIATVSIPLIVSKTGQTNSLASADNLRKGLILDLPFDTFEPGGKVTDISGQGNDGVASGVRWTPDGKKGGALEFVADGSQVEITNNPSLNPEHLTLAAWIKTTTKDAIWRRVFDKSYLKGYALSIAGEWERNKWNGQVSLEMGPGMHMSLSKRVVADGQWHHLAATFDGTEQRLYVDGKAEGEALIWKPSGKAGATDFNLVIGCNRSSVGDYDIGKSFRGFIDEPMMWNRALSPEEIAFLYQSQQ